MVGAFPPRRAAAVASDAAASESAARVSSLEDEVSQLRDAAAAAEEAAASAASSAEGEASMRGQFEKAMEKLLGKTFKAFQRDRMGYLKARPSKSFDDERCSGLPSFTGRLAGYSSRLHLSSFPL